MSTLISCIVPVYNGERYLGETLDSVIAQTHRPIEVIAVDDGSTDGSSEIIRGYGDRVRVVRQPNTGESAARNAGLEAAHGELVAFLDADDLWLPEKLALQLARLAARPELDISLTRFRNFWVPELADEERRYRGHALSAPSRAHTLGVALIRSRLFERVGRFDPRVGRGSATMWFLRAGEAGAVIETLDAVLMRRRFHRENRTRAELAQYRRDFPRIVKAWLDSRRRLEKSEARQD